MLLASAAPAPAPAPSQPAPAPSDSGRARELGAPLAQALGELETWVKAAGGALGADILDVRSGVELAKVAETVAVNPASNQKLIVAAAVLRHLGEGHRFTSGIYGRIQGGVADSLVVRSDGDPSLSLAALTEMVRRLKDLGLRRVQGDVLVDQSAFDDKYVPPAFEQRPAEWAAYRAPVSAVALNRNSVTLLVTPGEPGGDARVDVEPPGYLRLNGRIRTEKGRKGEAVKLVLRPRGTRLSANLSGAIGAGTAALRVTRRIDNPELYAGYVLSHLLRAAGIRVGGEVKRGGEGESQALVVRESAPVSELLGELGKSSDNFYAEMLLKALAVKVHGRPGTSEAGALVLADWLRAIKAFDPGTVVANGSGLYDANRTTPHALVRVLAAAYGDPALSAPFLNQLAVGGVDGTLRARFSDVKPERSILGKTGTLNAVVALSGYVMAPDSNPIAYSIIVSGITGRQGEVRERIDAVVRRIHRELWNVP